MLCVSSVGKAFVSHTRLAGFSVQMDIHKIQWKFIGGQLEIGTDYLWPLYETIANDHKERKPENARDTL
jgi:hypothetical protein